jgi:hypothetical protein
MNHDDFEQKQYHLSVTAQMNQLYHQSRARWWTVWNRGVQIAVAVLAVIGVCLALAAAMTHDFGTDLAAIIVEGLAAVAAIALNVLPLGDWAGESSSFLRQWSDLREDIDALDFDLAEQVTPELIARLKVLDGKVHRICGSEPRMNEALLGKCYRDAERSRHSAKPACAASM